MTTTASPLAALITPACFPTPGVILRANDPAAQAPWREFATRQAASAKTACELLAQAMRGRPGGGERAAALTSVFQTAEHWRYQVALASPHADGRYGIAHAGRFRAPVTDGNPNLFQIGEPERYRDGATWDPATRAYTGGTETPASATMDRYAALAARLLASSAADCTASLVTLPGGRHAQGTALLRGDAARRAAAEIVRRITARGGDASRVAIAGDLIYAASAPEADRQAAFRSAMELLAAASAASCALPAWARAAWRLYQAPRTKRGTDAVIRVFLIAAGTCLLGHPPVLPHDIDLAAYVWGERQFTTQLTAVQNSRSPWPSLARQAG